jgi:2,3-bisphosphoglycerate-independent phosphoglycerate mutase
VVAPCLADARKRGDCRILVAPDHITSIRSKTHAGGPVPFVLWGKGVEPNGLTAYSEAEAAKAGVLYPDGHRLVPDMIQAKTLPR